MQSIMSKIPDVIFVLGGPGSGKGTVCTSLANVNVKDFMIGFLTVYLNFCFVFFYDYRSSSLFICRQVNCSGKSVTEMRNLPSYLMSTYRRGKLSRWPTHVACWKRQWKRARRTHFWLMASRGTRTTWMVGVRRLVPRQLSNQFCS